MDPHTLALTRTACEILVAATALLEKGPESIHEVLAALYRMDMLSTEDFHQLRGGEDPPKRLDAKISTE